MLVRLAVLS